MFAVPGWSVSSNLLKRQTLEPKPVPATNDTATSAPDDDDLSKSKKRKLNSGKSKTLAVNPANVADLYERVIEGKPKVKSKKQVEKRQKIAKDDVAGDAPENGGDVAAEEKTEERSERSVKRKKDKERKREKKAAALEQTGNPTKTEEPSTKVAPPAPATKPTPHLTPLQAEMRKKLVSARFRHLNQTLYTTPSAHSLDLFSENPEMFTEYHEGFRRQVEIWPENPVDSYINDIKTRSKARGGPSRKGGAATEAASDAVVPLPRTEKTCRIADLGCGDAALSEALQKDSKKLNLQIHSFDLFSPHPLVTRADIANLPLVDESIDVAIFCLALMGTNWIDFIEEAYRVLRWKGELWVAEIKSRFGRVGGKKGGRVEHSVGFRQKPSKKEKKKTEDEDAVKDDAALMVEVDGNEDTKQETDVSAFVEVLRKRGFVLKGEAAVDLSNRMFVKMHFVKGVTPIKGKCVPVPKGMEKMGLETWKKKPKGKFTDAEEDVPVSSEAGVLKPCVYKLR
ncbi:25S rRNA (adenine-N(1))-methyltransferase [Lachnellula hyalina]|uniref:Ribosomal RNA-processing protein 8 n=1 Tax=Lachnellula hyalina TaxID=1316788 RepID=A0A8H8QTN3_9HELO|nr:25S rRNA (adenine-N(1))-methyltransferase [Lachnellula hyalina]TVY22443.1 25S rRNA (adenine-N(1))-methyltransferase [Lachnellula hyalina]